MYTYVYILYFLYKVSLYTFFSFIPAPSCPFVDSVTFVDCLCVLFNLSRENGDKPRFKFPVWHQRGP